MDCSEAIIFGSSDSEQSKQTEVMAREDNPAALELPFPEEKPMATAKKNTKWKENPILKMQKRKAESISDSFKKDHTVPPPEKKFKTREEYQKLYRDCRKNYVRLQDDYFTLEDKYEEALRKLKLCEELEELTERNRKMAASRLYSKLQYCLESDVFKIL